MYQQVRECFKTDNIRCGSSHGNSVVVSVSSSFVCLAG